MSDPFGLLSLYHIIYVRVYLQLSIPRFHKDRARKVLAVTAQQIGGKPLQRISWVAEKIPYYRADLQLERDIDFCHWTYETVLRLIPVPHHIVLIVYFSLRSIRPAYRFLFVRMRQLTLNDSVRFAQRFHCFLIQKCHCCPP